MILLLLIHYYIIIYYYIMNHLNKNFESELYVKKNNLNRLYFLGFHFIFFQCFSSLVDIA